MKYKIPSTFSKCTNTKAVLYYNFPTLQHPKISDIVVDEARAQ